VPPPRDAQPDRLNLFWWFGVHAPLQFSEMETMMYISLSWAVRAPTHPRERPSPASLRAPTPPREQNSPPPRILGCLYTAPSGCLHPPSPSLALLASQGFLTLLSARNEGPFWSSMPGAHLCGAFVFSISATTLIGALLKEDSISFWACPIEYIGVTLVYNLLAFVVLDFFKVVANKTLDRVQRTDPQRVKESRFHLWSQNRATLASEPLAGGSRGGSRMTGGSRVSRPTHQSIGNGDAGGMLPRSASGLSAVSHSTKARQSEVDRLQGAVAQLAGLVGSLAGNNAQIKSAVSEIIASTGGI